ncbi:uncharacterized protein LY89DRAFT_722981 [Mollisia scopiformis]|uniref:Uncharacterized protein n=1 Tax=Mollisia scopiformis TaxID=149040 RepID=A0A194WT40_MOLSC|nr:uncharacterized protein LY89DRAFT_722981 [Mollisia scopiformis]KUJ11125.1 hypothetical protein LY89DRAFT_722981 [Mollisia scopiformis]
MVEEISAERYIKQLNTNLLGVINVTRALMPHFRARKAGVVVFIGSSGGIAGEPGAGAYCASKFALEAGLWSKMNGNQPGDPQKAVNMMIDVVKGEGVTEGKEMPDRLPLGRDVLGKIRERYQRHLEVCEEWEGVICSTDFEGEERGDVRTVVVGE